MNTPSISTPYPSDDSSGASGYTGASDEHSAQASAKENLKQRARDTAEQLKTAASDIAAQAKERGAEIASERKTAVADRISHVGDAMRDSARSVEAEDPNIAWISNQAADRIQRAADYVRESDFAALRADTEAFARRHPAAILGGAFVAGLVVANLLKAGRYSRSSGDESWGDEQQPENEYYAEGAHHATGDAESAQPRPRSSSETVVPDDSEHIRESGPVPMGSAGNL